MKVHYNSSNNPSNQTNSSSSGSNKTQAKSKPKDSKGSKYFEGAKKGEVNELKQLLKNTMNDKDDKKRKEIIKKVIAYMTQGIDVSRLFSDMCIHSYTNDVSTKKMIYLYLTNYAEQNPDDVVMAINTFTKDCGHKDPKIRGLALRSLCSLRFSGSFDYLMPAIQEALKDLDPYVRKVAVLGCVKVYYVSPATIKNDADIIETLYKMIRDNDPLVITNAISALQEILEKEFKVSTKMIIYLLNRLKEFPEFSQAQVIQLAATYVPKSEQETFDIMNLLDERLRHSSVSIVLATINVFLNYTATNEKIQSSVYQRIKAPLLTLMSSCEMSGQFEVAYTVLQHILFLLTSKGAAQYFYSDYKQFYIKADETSYIKFTKLQILSILANENNIGDLLNELGEYVTDVDYEMAKNSIKTLGEIAVRISDMSIPIIKQLSTFIAMKREYITNQTILSFKDILRKYPEHFKEITDVISQAIDFVTDSESKVALFWILGQFGQNLEQSAYILENFVQSEENTENLDIKNALLTSSVKLFLKKPPQMQRTLAQVFKNILGNKLEDIDLRDRASFYYRAMQNDITEFKNVLLSESEKITDFTEDDELQKTKETLLFNTLSVIYLRSSDKYTKSYQYFQIQRSKEEQEDIIPEQEQEQEEEEQDQNKNQEIQNADQQQQNNNNNDINDVDLLLNMDSTPQQSNEQQFGAPSMKGITLDDLVENYNYDADDFETNWEKLDDGATKTLLMNAEVTPEEDQLDQLFKYYRIYSVATGEEEGTLKFYMYSKHNSMNQILLTEVGFNLQMKTISITSKSENEDLAVFFAKYMEELLRFSNLLSQ